MSSCAAGRISGPKAGSKKSSEKHGEQAGVVVLLVSDGGLQQLQAVERQEDQQTLAGTWKVPTLLTFTFFHADTGLLYSLRVPCRRGVH